MTDAPRIGVAPTSAPSAGGATVFDVDQVSVYYGAYRAVRDVSLEVRQHQITAFIGPSGCGKSTMLRCFNRMNDLIDTARVGGDIRYHGVDLYDPAGKPVEVRRRIGRVVGWEERRGGKGWGGTGGSR